jgi:hypothetical protein
VLTLFTRRVYRPFRTRAVCNAQGPIVIVLAVLYVVAVGLILRHLDRRQKAAQGDREAVYLHQERQRLSGWRA